MKGLKSGLRFEFCIIFLIALLMIYLIHFVSITTREIYEQENESWFNTQNDQIELTDEEIEVLREYRPGAYRMIEVYSYDFNALLNIRFAGSDGSENKIGDYPELIQLLNENAEGHAMFNIDEDVEEEVYFQWTTAEDGEIYLIIMYMARPRTNNLWILTFLSVLILCLIFILLIHMLTKQREEKIRRYNDLTRASRYTSL